MKYYFDGVIVTEGKNDVSRLSSFIDSIFVTTNGYDIDKDELDFLSYLPKENKIIILTDSDEAGKTIRERINKYLDNCINIEVDINKCNKNGKHGVAECDNFELLNVLKEHLSDKKTNSETVALSDILRLGISDQKTREYVCKIFHLGKCNNKTMVKRINYLNIKLEDIKKEVGKYGNKS